MTSMVVDRDLARRHVVAFHEAAHAAVAEALGWTVLYAWITDDEGEMDDEPPVGQDEYTTAVESAVIAMAGPAANERLLGYTPYGCEHDQDDAIEKIAGLDIDLAEIEAAADELVVGTWDRIVELADDLYENGEL